MSLRDLDSTYVKIDLDAMLDNLSAISEKAGPWSWRSSRPMPTATAPWR